MTESSEWVWVTMSGAEMIDGTGDGAVQLTAGKGEEVGDGSYMFLNTQVTD